MKTLMTGSLKGFFTIMELADFNLEEKIREYNSGITILAPSNEAWEDATIKKYMKNKEKLRQIIELHIVGRKITSDVVEDNNEDGVLELESVDDYRRKQIYFNAPSENNGYLSVEVGGVTARTMKPGIKVGDGVIHIIDRVLGVPYQTIRDKLKAERMFNISYNLGEYTHFNGQLQIVNKYKYTYFVPRDFAWQRAEIMYPNALKKLYSREYESQMRQILDRHLVIFNDVFTIAELSESENETVRLPTIRDVLNLKFKEFDKGHEMEWRGNYIPIYRGDIFCTNGVIHVIDQVLLLEKEVRLNGICRKQCFSLHTHLGLIILFKLYIS